MILILFLLFTLVPITEIYLLIQVGQIIGTMETIWLVILTGIIGAWAAKTQGQMVWFDLQKRLQQGEMPTSTMLQALLIFMGGLMLITPGIITDVFGFTLVMPPFRYFYVYLAQKWIARKIELGQFKAFSQGNMGGFEYRAETTAWRDVGPTEISDGPEVIDVRPLKSNSSTKGESNE